MGHTPSYLLDNLGGVNMVWIDFIQGYHGLDNMTPPHPIFETISRQPDTHVIQADVGPHRWCYPGQGALTMVPKGCPQINVIQVRGEQTLQICIRN